MPDTASVICVGGAAIDCKITAAQPIRMATSNPVSSRSFFGGVARNVAENLVSLGISCRLFSAVGDDEAGHRIIAHLRNAGVLCDGILVLPEPTANYTAALDPDGSLAVAFADMAIFDRLSPEALAALADHMADAAWLFADCNLPAETLRMLVTAARNSGVRLAIDTVSVAKSSRLPADLEGVDLLFANQDEAAEIAGRTAPPGTLAQEICDRGATRCIVTLGGDGCMFCGPEGVGHVAAIAADIVDVTGAGDALVAGTLSGLVAGHDIAAAVGIGVQAAAAVVASTASTITPVET